MPWAQSWAEGTLDGVSWHSTVRCPRAAVTPRDEDELPVAVAVGVGEDGIDQLEALTFDGHSHGMTGDATDMTVRSRNQRPVSRARHRIRVQLAKMPQCHGRAVILDELLQRLRIAPAVAVERPDRGPVGVSNPEQLCFALTLYRGGPHSASDGEQHSHDDHGDEPADLGEAPLGNRRPAHGLTRS